MTGVLTLDTQGDPDAFFVFQMQAAFAAAAASSVVFLNGPTDSIYWQSVSAFSLGADCTFMETSSRMWQSRPVLVQLCQTAERCREAGL